MSLAKKPLSKWTDADLAAELRFRLRFEHAGSNNPVDMFSRLLCEATARILERTPKQNAGKRND